MSNELFTSIVFPKIKEILLQGKDVKMKAKYQFEKVLVDSKVFI